LNDENDDHVEKLREVYFSRVDDILFEFLDTNRFLGRSASNKLSRMERIIHSKLSHNDGKNLKYRDMLQNSLENDFDENI